MYRIGNKLDVPSKFFLAPINTGLAISGAPTEELLGFHRIRAGRGIGVAYVGNVAIDETHGTNPGTLCATSESALWPRLAEIIAESGSVPAAQLAMRFAPAPASRKWTPVNTATTIERISDELSAISTRDLDEVPRIFNVAARTLAAYGFGVLQLHAAHGYLLSQLLTPTLNRRSDEYGRDPMLLLRRCIYEVRSAAPGVVLDVRLSLVLGAALEYDCRGQIDQIITLIDMLSISAGHYETSRDLIYPARRNGENTYLGMTSALAGRHPVLTFNCAGNIRQISRISIPANVTVSIGRPLLADPEFVTKSLDGREAEISHCDWNGACHYYTRGTPHIECPLSPDLNVKGGIR